MSEASPHLAARLRELHGVLAQPRDADWPGIPALVDRLERDLLPRTAGEHDHLVVGIVGPNNAGKSALFNALVAGVETPGATAPPVISPSIATGGATRRLVGALHADLRVALEAEPTLQRFPMRGVTPGPNGVEVATESVEGASVSELLLVETSDLPESLLLVDTPDFDSVLRGNRAVTDALLAVADVALVVVTKHTYQNHDVIEFLGRWLDHGRPWVLVYNESIDDETTRAHADKIEADLGGVPEAIFHAPFDLGVARGEHALVPLGLDDEVGGVPLARWLRDLGARTDLKARAMEASLAGLRDDLEELGTVARSASSEVVRLTEASRARGVTLGRAVAREAMPMGPFLEAFREVLDERPSAVQREFRRGLKWTGTQLFGGARWVASKLAGSGATKDDLDLPTRTLLDAERAELDRRWTGFYEPALVDLRRASRGGAVPERAQNILASATEAEASARVALARAGDALALDPALLDEHRAACREIIARELDERGNEWFLQLAVDAMHLLPLGLAGAVIVQTGGMGADVAVAGGAAAAAAVAERLSRTLGTGVAMAARARWTELRSEKIADAALTGLLGPAVHDLAQFQSEAQAIAAECGAWSHQMSFEASER